MEMGGENLEKLQLSPPHPSSPPLQLGPREYMHSSWRHWERNFEKLVVLFISSTEY